MQNKKWLAKKKIYEKNCNEMKSMNKTKAREQFFYFQYSFV